MQVNFYTFAKKQNSTEVPSTVDASFNCKVLSPSSVLSPSIALDLGSTGNPTAWNYAFISDYGRYYWVSDWQSNLGFWTASLRVDPLATYRGAIMSSSALVVRSASDSDPDLVDTIYPAKGVPTFVSTDLGTRWLAGTSFDVGSLVVGVIGADNVAYYRFPSMSSFTTFWNNLMSNITIDSTFGPNALIESPWLKAVVNPLQFFTSMTWIPINTVGSGTTASTIAVGYMQNISTGGSAVKLSTPLYGINWTITVPKHPQASTRGAWLNAAPQYSIYDYYFPGLGSYRLNTADLANETSLTVYRDIDVRTGTCRVTVKQTSGGKVLLDTCAQIGVPIMLAQSSPTMETAPWTGGASLVTGTFGSLSPVGLATGIATFYERGVAMTAADNYGVASTINSNGAVTGLTGTERLTGTFFELTEDANVDRGKPLCKYKTLSTLSGYTELLEGEIAIAATNQELEEIKNYLTGGFYLE